jgi:hypothetical protein
MDFMTEGSIHAGDNAGITTMDATIGTSLSERIDIGEKPTLKYLDERLNLFLNETDNPRTILAREIAGKMGNHLIMRLRENSARLYDLLNGYLSSDRSDNQVICDIVKEGGGMDELHGLTNLLVKCNQLQKKIAVELKGCGVDYLFDHNLEMAIRIGKHDLRNIITPPHTLASYFLRNQDSYDSEDIDELSRGLWETMVFCTSIEYLVTKDPTLLFEIPAKQRGGMIQPENVNCDGVFDERITNVAYLIRHQSIKNARNICLGHKIKDWKVNASVYEEGSNLVISVQDNGLGIVDGAFNPLPADKIAGIFGEDSYTPGGTGLGLQLVDRYVSLLGGSYEVTTTTKGGRIVYNSRTRQAVEEPGTFSNTGSIFKITLPKDYKRMAQILVGELVLNK